MATRRKLAERIANAVESERLFLRDARDGWPAILEFDHDGRTQWIALFCGPIGSGHRESRADIERRWQNPAGDGRDGGNGKPIDVPDGAFPVLVGAWFDDRRVEVARPVFAIADVHRRVGRGTRYSVFAELEMLRAAASTGWVESTNNAGETVTYLLPELLPAFLDDQLGDLRLPSRRIADIVVASGLTDGADPDARERTRRQVDVIVRSARFARDVVEAYGGLCALCGLNAGLPEGAHIYPASAPGSQDVVQNGLALCPNHHSAFDRHLISIDSHTRDVDLHPELWASRERSAGGAAFVDGTFRTLAEPQSSELRPASEFIERRRSYFAERLEWAMDLAPE